MLISNYVERMKLFIAEEALAGSGKADIRAMREDPESNWNKEKEGLNKEIKKEVAGVINMIHSSTYLEGVE